MNIEKLIGLFEHTHSVLQQRAARSVDTYLVVRNWLFGWYIVEFENGGAERAELYGKRLIDILSESLSNLGIKGMSPTNLRKFREFYQNYKIQQALPVISPNANQKIQQALPAELDKLPETMPNTIEYLSSRFVLGWTHYVTLMTVKNDEERRFYEIEAAKNGWGYRELETAIIDKLELFILELGKGFLFESRQKRFSFDNRHFYVDLVFYNRLLKCFVVIDLKIGDLKHQDLGQMQMYVNYFDRYVKTGKSRFRQRVY